LVPAARVPLLVVIQPLEAEVERGVRLRLLAAAGGRTRSRAGREAAIDDSVVRVGTFLSLSSGDLLIRNVPRAGRRKFAALRGSRSHTRHEARSCSARAGCRSTGSRQ